MNTSAATTNLINVEALLSPIHGDNPSGRDTQFAGLHDRIRDARREDDPISQGEWTKEAKRADWPEVARQATLALTNDTKDLQVCAWLTESLVKLHGLAGLRDGLKITRGLLENFWETLYPAIEYPEAEEGQAGQPRGEGDLTARTNILEWLSWQLAVLVKKIPVTNHLSGDNFSFTQWETTKTLQSPDKLKDLSLDERGQLERLKAEWDKARVTTKISFYDETAALLSECTVEVGDLDHACDQLFGAQAPSFGAFKKSLGDVCSLLDDLIKERRPTVAAVAGNGSPAGDLNQAQSMYPSSFSSGPIQSRVDALNRLAEVAVYFQEREPQSPVPLLVRRAIKWAQLPLEELLPEIIKNRDSLENVSELLGINAGAE